MGSSPDLASESDDPWAVGPLGPPIASFEAPRSLLLLGVIGSILFLALGSWGLIVAWIHLPLHGWCDGAKVGFALGVFVSLFGWVIAATTFHEATLNVYRCEQGFYCDRHRTRQLFPWKLIREVREDVIYHYQSRLDLRDGRWSRCIRGFRVTNAEGQTFISCDDARGWRSSNPPSATPPHRSD